MNRTDILNVLRYVVEQRITTQPRLVGSAALVLHGIADSANDVNIILTPREWGILTAKEIARTAPEHGNSSITIELEDGTVTFTGGHDYVNLWTTPLMTEDEDETAVGIKVSLPTLQYLLDTYEARYATNLNEEFIPTIAKIKAAIAA